jgi:phage shock protein A
MSVFTRFKDIISSNINSILDNAEDPEKMLKMMIQEMEDTLIELKSSCALKMSAREDVEDDVDIAESKILRWEARAKKALSIGEEELAKEALIEKRKIQKELKILKENISEFKKIVTESKKDIMLLEEKLEETIKKHDILIQRSLHAREKEKARRIIKNSESFKTGERFRHFESAIRDIEREVDFDDAESSNLDKKFEKMETDEEIQSELDELKKDLNK